jgi:hypothetical protein
VEERHLALKELGGDSLWFSWPCSQPCSADLDCSTCRRWCSSGRSAGGAAPSSDTASPAEPLPPNAELHQLRSSAHARARQHGHCRDAHPAIRVAVEPAAHTNRGHLAATDSHRCQIGSEPARPGEMRWNGTVHSGDASVRSRPPNVDHAEEFGTAAAPAGACTAGLACGAPSSRRRPWATRGPPSPGGDGAGGRRVASVVLRRVRRDGDGVPSET